MSVNWTYLTNESIVFAWSDAVATIYFIVQVCVASNRERCLLNSVLSVKSFVIVRALRKASFYKINEELQCDDLVFKQTFQLDQPPLWYKAVPTRHLQSVSSFSSNEFTRWSPSVKCQTSLDSMCYCTYRVYSFDRLCSHVHVLLEY